MVCNEIVKLGCIFAFILVLEVSLLALILKDFLPFCLKLSSTKKFTIFYSCLCLEHWWIPSNSNLEIYLSHFPFELILYKTWEIFGEKWSKNVANVLQLYLILLTIELKGTVHDPTVVESSHGQSLLVDQALWQSSISCVNTTHSVWL